MRKERRKGKGERGRQNDKWRFQEEETEREQVRREGGKMERREEVRRGEKGREKRASGETEENRVKNALDQPCYSPGLLSFITGLFVHTCPQSASL